jgi:hypothetical protein
MQNARKIILALTLLAMILCSWFALLDEPASQRIDAGLKRALISFATARTLNAVISVAQGTEVAIQPMGVGVTLTPGQLLEPVNDLVEKFASLMLAACVAFGIQKILIIIGGHWLVNLFLTTSALGWAWFYFRQQQSPQWLSKILVILLMVRFSIPMITIGTDLIFQEYMAAEYTINQQEISKGSAQVAEFMPSTETEQASNETEQSSNEDNVSWWGKVKKMAGSLASKATDALNVKKHARNLQQSAEKWVKHIINLIVIFLLQTLIIPILLIWALYALAVSLMRNPYNNAKKLMDSV